MDRYEILQDIIEHAYSIVVFTGAGISVPSGIPDFRSADGLYSSKDNSSYSPEEIISHKFFYDHPEIFYKFYKSKMLYPNAKPNLAHEYFAKLEKRGKNITVITQNIDGLHQQAGNTRVYELHGSVHRNYCDECAKSYSLNDIVNSETIIPFCSKCGGIIKPDVVLYNEPLDEDIITRSITAITTCDVLLVVGTSLTVYPAAGFLRYFKGKYIILINKSSTSLDNQCDMVFNEDVIDVVKHLK